MSQIVISSISTISRSPLWLPLVYQPLRYSHVSTCVPALSANVCCSQSHLPYSNRTCVPSMKNLKLS